MTQAAPAPAKTDAKKDEKAVPKERPAATGNLPLKGGKEGTTKTLDNKGVLNAPPDPKVLKAAQILAGILDAKAKLEKEGEEAASSLLDAFDKSKKAKKVRVVGEVRTYWFSKANLSKLVIEKKKANES